MEIARVGFKPPFVHPSVPRRMCDPEHNPTNSRGGPSFSGAYIWLEDVSIRIRNEIPKEFYLHLEIMPNVLSKPVTTNKGRTTSHQKIPMIALGTWTCVTKSRCVYWVTLRNRKGEEIRWHELEDNTEAEQFMEDNMFPDNRNEQCKEALICNPHKRSFGPCMYIFFFGNLAYAV